MKTILTGPYGVKLILDPEEIDLDDPGQGTPALVEFKGGFASYNCAVGEGEVDRGGSIISIPEKSVTWLDEQSPIIDQMFDDFMKSRA